ncbi:outer membrane beta-barrel family protein [Chryseobacterium sp. c4a]|uniref:outer membrane beta-barrel family protein n=1 Tax=Chryseobacterium sp. c4a TaxID=1573582 RepID=UPI00135AF571|nr:outer membrane beta-barrel family protein [Chryseobacterium sp. c4a]
MPKLKCLFYLLGLFFTGNILQAQSIHGSIFSNGGQSVSYLEIIISKGNIRKTTLSDKEGKFNLKLPENGNYICEIFDNGIHIYRKNIVINGDILEKFNVSGRDEKAIQEIVLTKKVIEQVGDKTFFNVENSVLSKGNSGLEVLQKSPKLNVNAAGELTLKNKEVSVLINGRKMNLSGSELNSYLQSLSSEEIKRVEIQDMASADQDATVTGGVVNIVLKRNPKGLRAIAKTYYLFRKEKYQVYNGGLNINYGDEKWNMYSDISYNENNDYGTSNGVFKYWDGQRNINENRFKQYYDNTSFRLGSVYYPNDKNTIGIEGYYSKSNSKMNSEGTLNIFNEDIQTVNSRNNSLSASPSDLWYLTVNYTLKTDDLGSSIKFIGDVGRNIMKPFNDVISAYPESPQKDSHFLYETHFVSKYYTGQLDWTQKLKQNWELNAGIKLASVKRDNLLDVHYIDNMEWSEDLNQKQNFDNRENIVAGYAMGSKTFGKHFLKGGLRIENTTIKGFNRVNGQEVKQDYTKVFPSLFYKYDLGNNKNISFAFKSGIVRPSFRDLNPFVIKQNDFLYQIGNSNLLPQYNYNFYLDYTQNKQTVSLYAALTENMIHNVYYNVNEITYNQPLNYGSAQGYGLDYTYNSDVFKGVYLNLTTGIFYNVFKPIDLQSIQGIAFYNNVYAQFKISKTTLIELFNNYTTTSKYRNVDMAHNYKMDIAFQKSIQDGQILIKFKIFDLFNTQRDKSLSHYRDFDFNFYQKRVTRGWLISFQYTFDNKQKMNNKTVNSDNESRNRL